MKTGFRWAASFALFGTLLLAATGCGDSAPARKGASKQIEQAKDAIAAGDMACVGKDYAVALTHYKNAQEAISDGKQNSTDAEDSTLRLLGDSLRAKIDEAELKQITDKPKEKTVVGAEIQKQDDAEKKKLAEDKAKADALAKKEAEKKAAMEKALAQTDTSKQTKKEDDGGATPPASPVAGGDKPKDATQTKGGGGDDAPEKKDPDAGAIAPAKAPYPAVTDKTEEVQIVKMGTAGRFVWAYFQLYNKSENGHRISTVSTVFKDSDNQALINNGIACFPFEGFRTGIKDMIGDQGADALTLGSDSIDGGAVRRYVVVGEHDRAKDVKRVTIQVMYQDGGKPYSDFKSAGK